MSRPLLRPCLVHHCFSQNLGEPRPSKCRCRYRVTRNDAEKMIGQGQAEWLIIDYRFDDEQKKLVPIVSWNLVWGQKIPEDDVEAKSAYAMKTPRVQTVEKAHMQRAYLDGKQTDIDRIEVWGEMARDVITEMIVPFREDPFEGRAILPDWTKKL